MATRLTDLFSQKAVEVVTLSLVIGAGLQSYFQYISTVKAIHAQTQVTEHTQSDIVLQQALAALKRDEGAEARAAIASLGQLAVDSSRYRAPVQEALLEHVRRSGLARSTHCAGLTSRQSAQAFARQTSAVPALRVLFSLRGANLNLDGMFLCGMFLSRDSVFQVSFRQAHVPYSTLSAVTAGVLTFRGALFSHSAVEESTLDDLDFEDAIAPSTVWSGISLKSGFFAGATLTGDSIRASRIEQSSFFRTKMANSVWQDVMISHSSFDEAILTGTQMSSVTFDSASLDRAMLDGAVLTAVTFRAGSSARGVSMKHARVSFWQVAPGVDLSQDTLSGAFPVAGLAGVVMIDAVLLAPDFTGADFRGSDLTRIRMQGQTSLVRAKFADAILVDADFGNADITGADLARADLRGANLSAVRGFDRASMNDVRTNARTRWPSEAGAFKRSSQQALRGSVKSDDQP
jgi:uncharacterized protein YjbI with pentapeptide repeats